MARGSLLSPVLLVLLLLLLLASPPAEAGTETRTLDPLAANDLSSFKIEGEGEWKVEKDLVGRIVVCEKPKKDTTLLFTGRGFRQGFVVTADVRGGSKAKGLVVLVVPEKGEPVEVPFKSSLIGRKGWHELTLTVEEGAARVQVGDREGKSVEVPEGALTFAFTLKRRKEASLRKLTVKYLQTNEPQREPEEDFVRIFDGKSLDGWRMFPEGTEYYELTDEKIEGSLPREGEHKSTNLVFLDGQFGDMELRFRIAADSQAVVVIGRPGVKGGSQATVCRLVTYFPGGADWYDVDWIVEGKVVTLKIDGKQLWQETAPNDNPVHPEFIIGQGGRVAIRDVRVKGRNLRPGPSWSKYGGNSGGATARGGADTVGSPSAAAADGRVPPTPDEQWTPPGKELFNGRNLTDWQAQPESAWTVADGVMEGSTVGREEEAAIRYTPLVFTDYLLKFKVKKGSKGAVFVARVVPRAVADLKPVGFAISEQWLGEEDWTKFEILSFDDLLTVKAGGKQVWVGQTHPQKGFVQFSLRPDSRIGVKDITWDRPPKRH